MRDKNTMFRIPNSFVKISHLYGRRMSFQRGHRSLYLTDLTVSSDNIKDDSKVVLFCNP